LKELVAEDQEALRVADVDPTTTDPLIHALADLLGVEPSLLLRGCAAFNQAPYNVRSAFFDILVDQMPIREWAARNGCDEARARASLKRALWLLGVHRDLDLDEFLGGRSDGS
jgi:DNA-directed RNA polymerase specialized sigma24 family protein